MPSPTEADPGNDSFIQQQLRSQQVKLVLQNQPISIAYTLLVMAVAAILLAGRVEEQTLLVWYGSLLLVGVIRSLLVIRYRRTDPVETGVDNYLYGLTLTAVATGALCGLAIPLSWHGGDEIRQVIILFLVGGIATASLATFGPLVRVYSLFLSCIILPGAAWMYYNPDPNTHSIGLVVLFFFLILVMTARTYASTLKKTLRLHFTNTTLNQHLFNANARALRNSQELEEQISQRKQAESNLAAYARKLKKANQALQQELSARDKNEQALTDQALSILESEVQMRAIFLNAFDAIITFTPGGIIKSCNPAAETMFGYTKSMLAGKHIRNLLPDYNQINISAKHSHHLFGLRASKEKFPLAFSVEAMQMGHKSMYVGILHDETDAQRAHEALTQARDAAEEANKAKSEFLSSMSHELRTPMNAILGFSQLLESDPAHPLNDAQRESVEQITKAGWHLLELINGVLDLAKVEAGKIETVLEDVRIGDVIAECLSLIAPMAEQADIELVDQASDSEIIVRADATRFKQVILNLLSNGIKYNKPGGKVILSKPVERKGFCRMNVIDTGIGLTEEQTETIFSPFSRVAEDREEIEGTGIGLTITKKLLTLMGGNIGVTSEPGQGSKFWIELPLSDAQIELDDEPAEAGEEKPAETHAPNHATLLYVEDNPANLVLVQNILSQRRPDVELLSSHNGELGLSIAVNQRPDVILLDIALPGMSGFEVLKLLQADSRTASIPTFAISANAMPRDIAKGLEAGFTHYLTKPIDVPEFLNTLDSLLEQAGKERS
jgi:PAS domain S-box-containing protein